MNAVRNLPMSSPERLAYWYFRLNGFLTIENFIVHPDSGSNQRTDADVLAVRFAQRAENLKRPMRDDPRVASCVTFANVIIAEIKTGSCELNGPWKDCDAQNLHRVLNAIGCVPNSAVDLVADALYRGGLWSDSFVTIRLFALGQSRTTTLLIPEIQQLIWDDIIKFCVERFKAYAREKSSMGQWADDGKRLRADALRKNPVQNIRSFFALPRTEDSFGGAP